MDNKATLVIMAAGIGSRFGTRIKQLEPIGPNGELLIDYSVYDALRAGFDRIVFIIRKDIEELFRSAIGCRISKYADVVCVFQEKDNIPINKELSALRIKPWGTGQAVLAAKSAVKGPFAIINADDFYGAEAFKIMYGWLKDADNSKASVPEYSMCGFRITNTLSENGTVTRGVCSVKDGFLACLEETKEIIRKPDGSITGVYGGETKVIPDDSAVSMNMWGFTAEYMDTLESQFTEYLAALNSDTVNSSEFLVPIAIDRLISDGSCKVRILPTESRWFGMTYEQDVAAVRDSVRESIKRGEYPEKLWN